jgi:hypothetical protein
MTTTTQLVIVGFLVAAAALYVARAAWKTWFTSSAEKGCGSGCGKCAAPPQPEPKREGRFELPQA